MKKSKEETAKTRKKIIQVAAREFRRRGLHETGVADIMAAAGLTQGGFYRHFNSKEHLVAEACGASMQELVDSVKKSIQSGNDAFLKHVERFLSNEHCQDLLSGCPLVFVGSELARADHETRKAVSEGYRGLVEAISNDERYKDSSTARAEAIFILSAMIGAVTLARIADDGKLSTMILDETRKHLMALHPNIAQKKNKDVVPVAQAQK
jgi:TetR/AcrR family transcriptional repressor of nem operon